GPREKYFINLKDNKDGTFRYCVKDLAGNELGPEQAKIFINHRAGRPRLLFKDEESGEWVEPASYYSFNAASFYEKEKNDFYDDEAGLTVRAVKSSVWHGLPSVAFKFMTKKSSLLYSADTVWRPSLWKELYETHRAQRFDRISRDKFEESSIVYADINDFIERTWSKERYERAMEAYKGSVIIHDIAPKNSVVHTDYADIADAPFENMVYTHNPDNLTSKRPMLSSGKRIIVKRGRLFECVKGRLFPFDADIYIRHWSGNLVGYRSESGRYKVIEKDGLLGIVQKDCPEKGIMQVELYEELNGEYFPLLTNADEYYSCRPDGKIERVRITKNRTSGSVVKSVRGKIR
ncbi:MAG: hypothetical protein GX846_00700, partial [Deltaproteobacteria bacterium]|nr:hypothetical protein [Deltaproteobacteria bacterium]